MKIATLFFLLTYSVLHAPHFLGPHDTLLYALIILVFFAAAIQVQVKQVSHKHPYLAEVETPQ